MEPANGKYRVSHVYRDGPADRDWIDISVGDYVQAIDRYGDVLTTSTTTVGDVRTAGSGLAEPRSDAIAAGQAAEQSRRKVRADQSDIFDAGHVVIGSPDEVADKIRTVCKEMNVGNLMLLLHFGNMSAQLTRHNTDLFARKVLPQIADLYENEWEHKWWPKGMSPKKRVAPRATYAEGIAAQ